MRLSNLLKAYSLSQNYNILILEKDDILGGAWRIENEKMKNLDLSGHLIVPENDDIGNLITLYL